MKCFTLLVAVLVSVSANFAFGQARPSRADFQMRDANVDGQLSWDEFRFRRNANALAAAKRTFEAQDLDQSRSLSQSEFLADDASQFLTPVELKTFQLTNAVRMKHGSQPLPASRVLCRYAREWSQKMATGKVEVGHGEKGTPDDGSVRRRAAAKEIKHSYRGGSENVRRLSKREPSKYPQGFVDGWMASKAGHRENLLNKRHALFGIGVAASPDGKLYGTQLFLKGDENRAK